MPTTSIGSDSRWLTSSEAPEPAKRIPFRSGAVFTGMHHLHLANHLHIYEALRDLLAR